MQGLEPDLAAAYLGRGNICIKLKQYDNAFTAYDLALTLNPGWAEAWYGRGNVHAELKQYGVNVTVLSPGPASTSFGQVAGQKNTAVIRMLMMEPKPVARAGIRAMLRHRSSVIAGVLNKLIVFSFRFTPRLMQGRIMQRALSG